jgi:hypothetical protein
LSTLDCKELYFLRERDGALIVYQEKDASWAGLLAFSSEELARNFVTASRLDVAEVASVSTADRESVASLIAAVKKRAVRYLILDLDYHAGRCRQVEFEGDKFGDVRERQLAAEHRHD